jgi:hypothetical protein
MIDTGAFHHPAESRLLNVPHKHFDAWRTSMFEQRRRNAMDRDDT